MRVKKTKTNKRKPSVFGLQSPLHSFLLLDLSCSVDARRIGNAGANMTINMEGECDLKEYK